MQLLICKRNTLVFFFLVHLNITFLFHSHREFTEFSHVWPWGCSKRAAIFIPLYLYTDIFIPLKPSDRAQTLLRKQKRTHFNIVEMPRVPRNDLISWDSRIRFWESKKPRCLPWVIDRANSNCKWLGRSRNGTLRCRMNHVGELKRAEEIHFGPVFRLIAIDVIRADSSYCFVHYERLFEKRFYFGNGGSYRPKFGVRSEWDLII